MYKYLGWLAATHPWKVCLAWLVLGVLTAWTAPDWNRQAQDDDIHFLPGRCDSVKGYRLLQQAFPHDVFASRIVFALERPHGRLLASDFALADAVVADLQKLQADEPNLRINRVLSPRDPFIGKRMVSGDGQCLLVQVSLDTPYLALRTRDAVIRAEQCVRRRLTEAGPEPPRLYTTGPAGVGRDLTHAGGSSLDNTTVATVLLVIGVLLFIYRAPLLALVPLATIAGATWIALKLLALCTLIPGFYLVNISQVFAVVMLYGAGTDYCLFLIGRYREELSDGKPPAHAIRRSVAAVGEALAASAGTVICGLSLMALAEFAKVRCGGPAIAVSLAVALAASLTLAPALLRLCGRHAFWPTGMPYRGARDSRRLAWDQLSRLVVEHPVPIWCGAMSLLVPLALMGLHVKAGYRATAELSPDSSSVQGLSAIQRHFVAGEVGPISILLESAEPWENAGGRTLLANLSEGFARLDNVAEVRSLTQPLGEPPAAAPTRPARPARLGHGLLQAAWHAATQTVADQVDVGARQVYLGSYTADNQEHHVARLDVVLKTDPFDPQSMQTLDLLQIWLHDDLPAWVAGQRDVRAECYGISANARDLAQVTETDRRRINGLVLAGIFLILLGLVRRLWLAAYLLATVLLSYFATLGATSVFAHWVLHRPFGEVDWRVLFFLFTILVAVGEDYNILLVSRALQERKRLGSVEGMRRALAHTGGVITSCGLIMAGTFATLMLARLSTLINIGFALAFGVLLDTFIVRPLLVPAFMVWVWQRKERKQEVAMTQLPRRAAKRLERRAG